MSQTPGPSHGGGKVREKRRLSTEQPYGKRKPPTPSTMPTTRHSPRHSPVRSQPQAQPDGGLPLADIVQELALLRRAMEGGFVEAGKKSDAIQDEVVGKLEANDQAVPELQMAMTDVTLSVDKNSRAIHEVRAEVERREVELPDKVRAIVNEALDRPAARPLSSAGIRHRPLREPEPTTPGPREGSNKRKEAYDQARRSLKFWLVSREGNINDRTREFMVNELRLDQQYAEGLNFTAKRVSAPRRDPAKAGAVVKDEVLVEFDNTRERDNVRTYAKNLERKGCGLRLEIPDHLWPSFRALQQLGYELKQRKPTLRRNILFDDDKGDLKMDISTDPDSWKTVLPEEARRSLQRCRPDRRRRASVSREELDGLLGPAPGSPRDERMDEEDE